MTNKERGANVRRNLRRWRKPLLWMMAGWVLLGAAVSAGAIIYAQMHHLSQRRVQTLAEGCGLFLCLLLAVAWLTVLAMADRRRSD